MAADSSPARKIGAFSLLTVIYAGVPAIAVTTIDSLSLRHNTFRTIIAIALYEIIMVAIGFAASVSTDLRNRWSARVADSLDSWLIRTMSRYTRVYLKYVQSFTRYMDAKGLSVAGQHTLEMRDVLITLSLSSEPLHDLSADPVRQHSGIESSSGQTIWHWLGEISAANEILSIIGPPGSGKTTLLRHVAYILAKGAHDSGEGGIRGKIPVLVNLRDYGSSFSDPSFSLVTLCEGISP